MYLLYDVISSLFVFQVIPGITNEDPAVRNVAVRCLGLCCYLDVHTATKHLLLFTQVRVTMTSSAHFPVSAL